MARASTGILGRAALALLGLGLGCVVAEAGLRASYPTLPSLAPLHDQPDLVEAFTVEGLRRRADLRCDQVIRDPRGSDVSFGAGPPSRTWWFAGDSMTAGMGVEPGEEWPVQLAQVGQSAVEGQVVVRNLALPGVGYCEVVRRVTSELQFGAPDVVLVSLFGDDLESRALLARDGRLIGLPHTIEHDGLRWWARRSYAVNLAWFVARSRPSGPVRFIDGPGRAAFQSNLVALDTRIREAGAQPLFVLLEPVGIGDCTDAHRADLSSRCSWMPDDLDLMADLLAEADLPVLDLRGAWEGTGTRAIASELGAGVPAIHPDAAGHALLAREVWQRAGPLLSGEHHDASSLLATSGDPQ